MDGFSAGRFSEQFLDSLPHCFGQDLVLQIQRFFSDKTLFCVYVLGHLNVLLISQSLVKNCFPTLLVFYVNNRLRKLTEL